MAYYFLKVLSAFFCLLPRSLAYAMGRALGVILYPFIPKKRKELAFRQIKMCLPVSDAEARRIARASAVRFGPMLVEVLRFPLIKRHPEDYIRIENIEPMKAVMAGGKGCIIAASHSGNWERMGGAFAMAGIPMVGVAMKQKGSANRFINEYRAQIGMHITYKQGVREMFRMLKGGYAIGLIMDQDTNRHDGIILDFFGRETNCVPGAASMARFSDVPIFASFLHRGKDGYQHLKILGPFFVEKTRDKKEDIRKMTQKLTKLIEADIRAYPEDWFWLHDRWKSVRD